MSATAYVHSMCAALGNWRNDIQKAGSQLQVSGAGSASRPAAKRDYQLFVSALLGATQRAAGALRSAGEPSVNGGKQIADSLATAFDGASRKLGQAEHAGRRDPDRQHLGLPAGGHRRDHGDQDRASGDRVGQDDPEPGAAGGRRQGSRLSGAAQGSDAHRAGPRYLRRYTAHSRPERTSVEVK